MKSFNVIVGFFVTFLFYPVASERQYQTNLFTQNLYTATVQENSAGKTFVSSMTKMGIFVEYNSQPEVTYAIVAGDVGKNFKAESRIVGDFAFLRIRTRSSLNALNREQQDLYNLIVRATIKHRFGTTTISNTTVAVHILDANDFSPMFESELYEAEVAETAPLHQSIITVVAFDADIGMNAEIYYSFADRTDMFAIHPRSGVMTLTQKLSYADRASFQLQVQASDRGQTRGKRTDKKNYATISVSVLAVNQHSPKVEVRERPTVVEHGKLGTIYAILGVSDMDKGENGQIDKVLISDGDPEGYFSIQRRTNNEYRIVVGKTIDRELQPNGFNLVVVASDKGNPTRSSNKTVQVRIQDINDNAPEFEFGSYNFTVDECLPIGTPVGFVSASDEDSAKNAELVYSIVGGNIRTMFRINSLTGLLSIANEIDAEIVTSVDLLVRVEDRANGETRKSAETLVRVDVTDCNDNSPTFVNIPSYVYVEENQPLKSTVYVIQATDPDQRDNGFVSFSLINYNDVPFAIDHFSGNIFNNQLLDYEDRSVYHLVVRATDWGSPFKRESEIVLKVRVKDVNDNSPKFEKADCTGYLTRDAPLGTELAVISAVDFDNRNIVSYKIASGNEDACFVLNPSSGLLSTNCSFKNDRSDRRKFTIVAFDGTNYADPISVNITLINNRKAPNSFSNIVCQETSAVRELREMLKTMEQNNAISDREMSTTGSSYIPGNLFSPKFDSSQSHVIIVREDVDLNSNIARLMAQDDDQGFEGRLQFVISDGNDGDVFKVETHTGDLYAMRHLDRETKNQFKLNVTVFDMGIPPKSDSKVFQIDIEDVNDCLPRFKKPVYSIFVMEDAPLKSIVLTVTAVDEDSGDNGRVAYSIPNSDVFSVDMRTGSISLNRRLDREETDTYDLTVVAVDRSSENPLSSSATVHIIVGDVNDNAPQFVQESGRIQILEDVTVGTVVGSLFAHDPDLSDAGVVRYSFLSGTEDKFQIDALTGIIRLVDNLDFNKKQFYNITTKAWDIGSPVLATKGTLVIEVIDVNHNVHPPVFKDVVFSCRVRENQHVGTSLIQLTATDEDSTNPLDSPNDYRVSYSIRDGSGLGWFTIDNRGIIKTTEILDREAHPYFWLTIFAQDMGIIPLSSSVEVFVEVEDVNDNIPQTVEPVYRFSVLENSPAGTSIGLVQAYDLDDPSAQFTFSLNEGSSKKFFQIDQNSGLLTTSDVLLDREADPEHILEVTVIDNGSPPLSSVARVIVSVDDVNDCAPEFFKDRFRAQIPKQNDFDLYRITAFDRDAGSNADISYSIVDDEDGDGSVPTFSINSTTGVIFSMTELDVDEVYKLQVMVTDGGHPSLNATIRVILTVEDVPTSSSSAPTFINECPEVSLKENDRVGQLVCLLTAVDDDDDEIWFYITAGNDDNTFTIDMEEGNLLLAKPLDSETRNVYNLSVVVTNGIHSTSTQVNVIVMDVNDNSPYFSQSIFVVNLTESIERESEIIRLTATDLDQDKRLIYSIQSVSSLSSADLFKIDPETGVITTTSDLNRESMSHHELTVMVRDHGMQSRRDYARVIVHLIDHNEFAPEFLQTHFQGHIHATSSIGTSVLQVVAFDKDLGTNAEINYDIVEGNPDEMFHIDRKLGIVTLAQPLVDTNSRDYNLTVIASDEGVPSLSSTAQVLIKILTTNVDLPKFERDEYVIEIEENKRVGSFVVLLQAGFQSSILYQIETCDLDCIVTINPSSGAIFTSHPLDYEMKHLHNISVKATSMAGDSAFTHLIIHVLDVNDNRPMFVQENFTGHVSESAEPRSHVLDMNDIPLMTRGIDIDSNENGLLVYKIVESSGADAFSIDPSSGILQSKIRFDRELVEKYEFTIQVSDHGSPSLSALVPAKVTIFIDDVNDSPPVFKQDLYKAEILLPLPVDVEVLQVSAFDPDSAPNALVEYSIVSGNPMENFRIHSKTGVLTYVSAAGIADDYELTIKASDGQFDSFTRVQIEIGQIQDTGLKFSKDTYEVQVRENITDIQLLAVLQVTEQPIHEHLTYTLLNPGGFFRIRSAVGVLETTGVPIDRELVDYFVLAVEVVDHRSPPRVARCLVNVTVLDVNDNQPIFVNQPYVSILPVDALVGEVVLKLTVIDKDMEKNGAVELFVVEGDDDSFALNRTTGALVVNKPLSLNGNNTVTHRLLVEARDGGEIPLNSRAEVVITVRQKDAPVFEKPMVYVSVPENIPVYSTIVTVRATSPTGSQLMYSIVNGDVYQEFAVDFNIGSIMAVEHLDHEISDEHELTIRATDMRTGFFADVVVHINVEDVNDNKPMFERHLFNISMSEFAPVGSVVATINASDADSDHNARIRYHLEPHSSHDDDVTQFVIDPGTGIVTLKQKLDFELSKKTSFIVVAADGGIPTLSSSATVFVNVIDMNDNIPRFDTQSYNATMSVGSKRGQFVTRVHASDVDECSKGMLTYSIISGNPRQIFAIDRILGTVSLAKSLQGQLAPSTAIVLNVSVTDGIFTNFTGVTIRIAGQSRYVPRFEKALYSVDVVENLPAGQSLCSVVAFDDDPGIYGQLTYSIISNDLATIFDIDTSSGKLTTKIELDQKSKELYHVQVAATDGAGLVGYATIDVHVLSEDILLPDFLMTEYMASIYSRTPVGTSILRMQTQLNQGDVDYSVVLDEGSKFNGTQYFTVNSKTGHLVVTSSLTGKENELFEFFVRASNKRRGKFSSDVPVGVYIMGNLDRSPVYSKLSYRFSVAENVPVGHTLGPVKAQSNDSLNYSLITSVSDSQAQFEIDETGLLKIAGSLDRELKETYQLTVRASTDASPPLVAHAQVTILVTDVNDNSPKFDMEDYVASIAENVAENIKVIQVVATDPDSGSNGTVMYRFANDLEDDSVHANYFSLDESTGWITSRASIDRELWQNFEFEVVATDNGTPARKSSTATVVINVLDQNDEKPVFDKELYVGEVSEDASPGMLVVRVTVSDGDVAPNNKISLYIIEGDPTGRFGIHDTGEIWVNRVLDHETQSSYELVVLATDGAFVSQSRVAIAILDVNDNAPVCDQLFYETIVSENLAPGSAITRITARDDDGDGTENSNLEYQLDSEHEEVFAVHSQTGVVSLRKSLDRETTPEYQLWIVVRDVGGLTCQSELLVIVGDVNDNAPRFTKTQYTFPVPENSFHVTLVGKVSATDDDLGINRKIRYSLEDPADVFTIDAISGVISVTGVLDREVQDFYNFTIVAIDQGQPPLSSTATVSVILLDVNDNPPQFEFSMYLFNVSESTPIGSVIGGVYAVSKDVGVNAEITYSIPNSASVNNFAIDPFMGYITITGSLDYESIKEYSLSVQAADGGTPSLSSTAIVIISVTDENDNPPVFVQAVYQCSIKENANLKTNLVQVEAYDNDGGVGGQIEYRLDDGDEFGQYQINSSTGQLTLMKTLDRESISMYVLKVLAVDQGIPSFTSTALIDVTVLDINDCPPRFANTNFTSSVLESSELGTSVFTLEVDDDDLDPNRGPFSFDIIAGNQNEFMINRNGVLLTTSKLRRIVKDGYSLRVRAFDNGSPPLFSDVDVYVAVIEESSSPPVISPLSATIITHGDSFSGGFVGQVKATDPDLYDQLVYALIADNHLFSIDSNTGSISSIGSLDAGEYMINVSVTDGKFVRHVVVHLNVESMTSEMIDNAVVVRFESVPLEEFGARYLMDFIGALKSELTVREADIKVLSIKKYVVDTPRTDSRKRRELADASSPVDVLLAIRKSANKYVRGDILFSRLKKVKASVEKAMGLKIVKIFNDVCTEESCDEGECRSFYMFDNDKSVSLVVDGESVVTSSYNVSFKCICPSGLSTSDQSCAPAPPKDICTPGLCKEPKICSSNGQTYTCSCPVGRTGDECLDVVEPPCVDMSCRKGKPMTFNGKSFIRWRFTVPLEKRLTISLDLKTIQQKARIMHAVGPIDYSILEIEDGVIQFRFNFGSGPGVCRVDNKLVSDGQWHSVVVERISKNVKLIVDNDFFAETNAPGLNDALNLDSSDVFFGAEVILDVGFKDIRQGFVGCMQKIKSDRIDLPLVGSSSVGVLQQMEEVDFHCRVQFPYVLPNPCNSFPCRNAGTCFSYGNDAYRCNCRTQYSGINCEMESTNPCLHNPCHNGGTCEVDKNDFWCKCQKYYRGRLCEFHQFCASSPCKQYQVCKEGLNGPTCTCPKGFSGDQCKEEIECTNPQTGLPCNCSSCVVQPAPVTDPQFFNTKLIIIIAGVCGCALLIIVIISLLIVCGMRSRRRRKPSNRNFTSQGNSGICRQSDGKDDNNAMCLIQKRLSEQSTDDNREVTDSHSSKSLSLKGQTPKMSPRPPPLPKRPNSYTPSTADTINISNNINLDRAGNYGSAADDLNATDTEDLSCFYSDRSPNSVRHLPALPSDPHQKGLNNLNKKENYGKIMNMDSKAQGNEYRRLLPSAGSICQSVGSLTASEDGYTWDNSDWNPAAMPAEVMPYGRCSSPSASFCSRDCEAAGSFGNISTSIVDEGLSFQDIMAMKDQLDYGDLDYAPRESYKPQPNLYMTSYDYETDQMNWSDELPSEVNGNFSSSDYIGQTKSKYPSESDVSEHLCKIEDSEDNASNDGRDDEKDEATTRRLMSSSGVHTLV